MPRIVIGPNEGWKSDTYYHVEASFHENDEIKGYVLIVFNTIRGKISSAKFVDTEMDMQNAVYIRFISALFSQKDVDNVPRKGKIVKDYYPF